MMIKNNVASIRNTSLIDWNDHISSVIFMQGCNMDCHYCHSSHLIPWTEGKYTYAEAIKHLSSVSDLCTGIVISGGEPLSHTNIIGFIRGLSELGKKIKLDTNCSLPNKLREALGTGLISFVSLDVKPENGPDKLSSCVNACLQAEIPFEVRATVTEENFNDIMILQSLSEVQFVYTVAEEIDKKFKALSKENREEIEMYR